ncbi:MAG TPA: RNA polymerase sigma factor [Gemmatimonadaceae bacterium]|nr:RNA polymerase sigma factor [Gemmatimonadaceae bacterium]
MSVGSPELSPTDRRAPRRGADGAWSRDPLAADASDALVIEAVLDGDDDAFALLVRRYRETYARFACCMLGDERLAEDALQAAFVRAYASLERCPGAEQVGWWLYGLVKQECESLERRAAPALPAPGPPSAGSSTAESMRRALAAVPLLEREAFVLRFVEELTYEECVRLTGVDGATFRARVHGACRRLQARLAAPTSIDE